MTTMTALDIRWAAVRAGLSRGWIETRQNLTETIYVIGHALPAVAQVAVLLLIRGKNLPGTDFALGTMVLPSLLGMTIVFGGLSGPAIKPIALRMCWEVARNVDIPVIGIGGIRTADDALEFLCVGCSAVQIGTAHYRTPDAVPRALAGLRERLAEAGRRDVRSVIRSVAAG